MSHPYYEYRILCHLLNSESLVWFTYFSFFGVQTNVVSISVVYTIHKCNEMIIVWNISNLFTCKLEPR